MDLLESKHKRLELLMKKGFFSQTIGDDREIKELKDEIKELEKGLK